MRERYKFALIFIIVLILTFLFYIYVEKPRQEKCKALENLGYFDNSMDEVEGYDKCGNSTDFNKTCLKENWNGFYNARCVFSSPIVQMFVIVPFFPLIVNIFLLIYLIIEKIKTRRKSK